MDSGHYRTISEIFGEPTIQALGALANPLVHSIYPFERMYDFHRAMHLPGLTGRWMDTGAFALGGKVAGPWHRLAHGHHLMEDGLRVAFHPKLKFGHFLHHLGLDALTKTGVPNPLVPSSVGGALLQCGIPKPFVQEFLTLNAPKLVGGSLGVVLAGNDVVALVSGNIPATFGAAGKHFAFGCLNLVFGCYPPNFLLLTAAGAEFAVAGVTVWRAWNNPIVESVNAPAEVFFPSIGEAIGIGVLGGLVAATIRRRPDLLPKLAISGGAAAGTSKWVATAALAQGAPYILGPLAGVAVALLLRRILVGDGTEPIYSYHTHPDQSQPVFPAWTSDSPVGTMTDDGYLEFLPNGLDRYLVAS